MKRNPRRWACLAARAAADKKAIDIKVFHLRAESDVADFVVIAGVESTPQLRAVYQHVIDLLWQEGIRPLHQDGRSARRWTVLDYGDLVVHILLPEVRLFYRLEQIWEKPKSVAWQVSAPRKRRKRK